ncbi:MAG: hypothetical protein V1674_00150 [Candidatus Omnitrophota bacterium]
MRRLNKKAISLAELVITIAIMVILAVMALIRTGYNDTLKLNACARKIAGDIRYVQQLAMTESKSSVSANPYIMDFNPPSASWVPGHPNLPLGQSYMVVRSGLAGYLQDPYAKEDLVMDFTKQDTCKGVNFTNVTLGTCGTCKSLRFSDNLGTPLSANLVGYFGSWAYGTYPLSAAPQIAISYKGKLVTIYITPETGLVRIE